jgi:3'5'-cyclic nucleotide phosphodiesterase
VDAMLSNHSTDPFALNEQQMVYLAIRMLETYGLVERYKVEHLSLGAFLHAACSKYHSTNAFHNIKHGWGTLHLSYRILKSGGDEKLQPVEIFALLIGAICHDLDHPGNNNGFEVAARTERALIYADDTVLERHHTACALQLLDEHDYDILGNMGADEVDVFRKTMITCIMSTDMAQHFQEVEYLHEWSACTADPFDKYTERAKLAGVILHCADIGAQTQKNELAIKWSDAVLNEFRSQAQREKVLGVALTPFMQGLDDEIACNHLQQGFIGNIVLPLWSALAACFPKLDFAVSQAHENMQIFKAKAVGLKAIHGWRRKQTLKQSSFVNLPT